MSNGRVGLGTETPSATLEVTNTSTTGVPLLQMNSNDTDQIMMDVNAANITANVFDITADGVTTADVMFISMDGATNGSALAIEDKSGSTSSRDVVEIQQTNATALNAKALSVESTGSRTAMNLSQAYTNANACTTTALVVNVDKTTATTTDNTIYGIDLDLDNTTATNGTNAMVGLRVTPTLTHAADAGTTTVKGIAITATGGTNGTATTTGLELTATGADTNMGIVTTVADGGTDIRVNSSADTGDYFSIATTTHGATTIATVDDDATAAHLTLDVDGDITLDADGGDVIFKDGGTEIGRITNSSNNLQIASSVSDGDIKFYGNDGGSGVTALTLDMSDAGAATFNSTAAFRNNHTATGTFSGDIDLSSITKSLNYYVTDAMADGEDIKLPTPTAALAGMVIRIIFTQNTATSISTGIKVGIAHGASAALEGAITLNGPGASSDTLAMVSSSGIHSLQLDSDSLTNAGGAQGSIYEFHYHGSTTLVFVRGWGITTNTGTCALATLTGSPGVTEAVAAAGVS